MWSRFLARTDGRTGERTKVFEEVLANLKKQNHKLCTILPPIHLGKPPYQVWPASEFWLFTTSRTEHSVAPHTLIEGSRKRKTKETVQVHRSPLRQKLLLNNSVFVVNCMRKSGLLICHTICVHCIILKNQLSACNGKNLRKEKQGIVKAVMPDSTIVKDWKWGWIPHPFNEGLFQGKWYFRIVFWIFLFTGMSDWAFSFSIGFAFFSW